MDYAHTQQVLALVIIALCLVAAAWQIIRAGQRTTWPERGGPIALAGLAVTFMATFKMPMNGWSIALDVAGLLAILAGVVLGIVYRCSRGNDDRLTGRGAV